MTDITKKWICESVNNFELKAMNFSMKQIIYVNCFKENYLKEMDERVSYIFWDTDKQESENEVVYTYYIDFPEAIPSDLTLPEKKTMVNLKHPAIEGLTKFSFQGFNLLNVNLFPNSAYYSFLILNKYLPVYNGMVFYPEGFPNMVLRKKIYRNWLCLAAWKVIKSKLDDSKIATKIMDKSWMFMRFEEKNFEDWESKVTWMTDRIIKGNKFNMTKELVDLYLRTRHDLICKSLSEDLKVKYTGDVDLKSLESNLTPDFFIKLEDMTLDTQEKLRKGFLLKKKVNYTIMMDISVSDYSMEPASEKSEKYNNLCMKLNEEQKDREYIYQPVHVCLSLGKEMRLSKRLNLLSNMNKMVALVSSHFQRIKDNEFYSQFKEMIGTKKTNDLVKMMVDLCFPKIEEKKEDFRVSEGEWSKKKDMSEFLKYSYLLDPTFSNFEEFYDKLRSEWDNSDKVPEVLNKEMEELFELGKDSHLKIKHFCKLPILEESKVIPGDMQMYLSMKKYRVVMNMFDKTVLYKETATVFKKKKDFIRRGLGFNKLILSNIDTLVSSLMRFNVNSTLEDITEDTAFFAYENMKASKMLLFLQELSRRIMLLANKRRSVLNRNNIGVIHPYKEYMLEVAPGPMITREKVLTCRLIYNGEISQSIPDILNWTEKKPDNLLDLKMTPWFSISLSDLEHYARVSDKAKVIVTNYILNLLETLKQDSISVEELMKYKTIGLILAVLMEHKRATSTTLQMNRYLIMSYCSLYTDSLSLAKKINCDPVWSSLQMYVLHSQMNWFSKVNINKKSDLFLLMEKLMTAGYSSDYDRFEMQSIFSEKKQEFKLMMDEMYLSNLFNKEHGFISHRVKAIMKKAAEDEMKFKTLLMNNKDLLLGKAKAEDILRMEDSSFVFDRKFVSWASSRFWDIMMPKISYYRVWECMTESMENLMTLKSSLVSVNMVTDTLSFSEEEVRSKTVETQFLLCKEYSTTKLISILNYLGDLEVLMGMFPKSQIGGPREILIQSYKSRPYFRMVENISKYLCSLIPEEMISRGKTKALIQANIHNKLPLLIKKKKKYNVIFNINRDHSHWAPSTNLETFKLFWSCSDFASSIKAFFMTFMNKMANKRLFMPPALKKKWKKAQWNEYDEELQWLKTETEKENYSMIFNSGFGQGMMQSFSSLYHCMIKSTVLFLYEYHTKKLGLNTTFTSQISSDDNTDYLIINLDKMDEMRVAMAMYLHINNFTSKMCNIHENRKKTGASFLVSEFNSQFMVVRRMMTPLIKFLYNSMQVVDYTMPEMAVRMHISNEKRVFEEGGKIPILSLIRELNYDDLVRVYRLDTLKLKLEEILGFPEELPFIFGFMPKKYLIPTLMFGPELQLVWMLDTKMKDLVIGYYNSEVDYSYMEGEEDEFWEMGLWESNKVSLETRLDKLILDLRRKMMSMSNEQLKTVLDKDIGKVIYKPSSIFDLETKMNMYMINVNRRYEMSDNMMMHSMVRAMSLVSQGVMLTKDKKRKMMLDEYCVWLINNGKKEKSEEVEKNLRQSTSFKFLERMIKEHDLAMESLSNLKPIKMFNVRPKVRSVVFTENVSFKQTNTKELMQIMIKGLKTDSMSRRDQSIMEEFSLYLGNVEKNPNFTEKFLFSLLTKEMGGKFLRITRQFSRMTKLKKTKMVLESSQVDTFFAFFSTIFRYRTYSTKVLAPMVMDMDLDMRPVITQTEVLDGLMTVSKDLDMLKSLLSEYIFFKNAKLNTKFFQSDSMDLTKVKFAVKCSKVKNLDSIFDDVEDRVLFTIFRGDMYYLLPGMMMKLYEENNLKKVKVYTDEKTFDLNKSKILINRAYKEIDKVKDLSKWDALSFMALNNKDLSMVCEKVTSLQTQMMLKRKEGKWAIFFRLLFKGIHLNFRFIFGEEQQLILGLEFFDMRALSKTLSSMDLEYFKKYMTPERSTTEELLKEVKTMKWVNTFYKDKEFKEVNIKEFREELKINPMGKEMESWEEKAKKYFTPENMLSGLQSLFEVTRFLSKGEESTIGQLILQEEEQKLEFKESKEDTFGFSRQQTSFFSSLMELDLDMEPYMEGMVNTFSFPLRQNIVVSELENRISELVFMPFELAVEYSNKIKGIDRKGKLQVLISEVIHEVETLEFSLSSNEATRMAKAFMMSKLITKLIMLFGDIKKEKIRIMRCNFKMKLVTYMSEELKSLWDFDS